MTTKDAVQNFFYKKEKTLHDWCRENNFPPATVWHALDTWADREEGQPRGRQTRKILTSLSNTTGINICPALKH